MTLIVKKVGGSWVVYSRTVADIGAYQWVEIETGRRK